VENVAESQTKNNHQPNQKRGGESRRAGWRLDFSTEFKLYRI
jgi:hypothetical protein